MDQEYTAPTKYWPVNKWPHPWPPAGGLRHLILHADKNGFSKVVKRVGGTVLIDEAAFFTWIEEQNKKEGKNES